MGNYNNNNNNNKRYETYQLISQLYSLKHLLTFLTGLSFSSALACKVRRVPRIESQGEGKQTVEGGRVGVRGGVGSISTNKVSGGVPQ